MELLQTQELETIAGGFTYSGIPVDLSDIFFYAEHPIAQFDPDRVNNDYDYNPLP